MKNENIKTHKALFFEMRCSKYWTVKLLGCRIVILSFPQERGKIHCQKAIDGKVFKKYSHFLFAKISTVSILCNVSCNLKYCL